jgi:hypothetical protein
VITRRLFLGGLLAAGSCAPAIVRSGVLMPVRPLIVLPPNITMEIGRIETFRFVVSRQRMTREEFRRLTAARDPLGRRGYVTSPGWTIGSPILNEHWMEQA